MFLGKTITISSQVKPLYLCFLHKVLFLKLKFKNFHGHDLIATIYFIQVQMKVTLIQIIL